MKAIPTIYKGRSLRLGKHLEANLFDCVEEEERGPTGLDPSFPGQNYFNGVNGIPTLSRAECNGLIGRWQQFGDQRARERVIAAHLRIPPAIARKAARKYGHEPNKNILSGAALVDAWKGYRELVEDLTAEGNLALVQLVDSFDTAKGFVFPTYAGRSIWNAVHRRLRSFASTVDRSWGKRVPIDIYIDPALPDMQSPEDYCGSRARIATPSDDDERKEGERLPGKYERLRPEHEPNYRVCWIALSASSPRNWQRL
jgi:hypothetical protein